MTAKGARAFVTKLCALYVLTERADMAACWADVIHADDLSAITALDEWSGKERTVPRPADINDIIARKKFGPAAAVQEDPAERAARLVEQSELASQAMAELRRVFKGQPGPKRMEPPRRRAGLRAVK